MVKIYMARVRNYPDITILNNFFIMMVMKVMVVWMVEW